ncbi:putative AMP-dependent synthetase/ligase, ANL domain-containing protein [Helianthus annuus]|nr:putative AMP-dependent synthetase/ligase, ANL domain-containing protein [Helianthus annuus]
MLHPGFQSRIRNSQRLVKSMANGHHQMGVSKVDVFEKLEAGFLWCCPVEHKDYGLSESTAVGTRGFNTRDLHNYTYVGLLGLNTQASVVDLVTGLYLPPGKTGELWLIGPAIMKEYLNDVEATSSTIDEDGWLQTGDIVYFDQDGYLHIVGRVKEIIKYKGFQVIEANWKLKVIKHDSDGN